VKKGSLHNEETPFSHEREALLDRKEYFGGIHPLLRRGLGSLLVEFHMGVSFCVFPCSFRNSVYLSGSVPFVHSVLKMP